MAPARPRAAATDDDCGLVALHRARFVDWAPSPVVALAPTARFNRLVTVTAQALDGDDWAAQGAMLKRVVASFVPAV